MALIKAPTAQTVDSDSLPLLHSANEMADFAICKSPEKLKLLLDKIQPDKHVHYVSDGDWSTHDLVMELIKKLQPCKLYFSTYAIREYPVRQIVLALDSGVITEVNMLIDARAKVRTPEVYHLAANNAATIGLTEIHAKVTVIKSPKGSVTIVGSANWTTNPRIEVGVITMNEEAADFHINWIKKTIANGKIFE